MNIIHLFMNVNRIHQLSGLETKESAKQRAADYHAVNF
jgi:hypothetical protein